jgi:hypothetical protein
MMQMLKAMGLRIAGKKHTATSTEVYNPGGIWEVPNVVYDGITTPIEDADVIKLAMAGIERTPAEVIDKVIFMVRHPRECIVSQRGQNGPMSGHELDENNWIVARMAYECWFKMVVPEDEPQLLYVHYKKLLTEPKKQVRRVADFLGIEDTKNAMGLINPDLYRAKRDKVPLSLQKYMRTCNKYYKILKEKT